MAAEKETTDKPKSKPKSMAKAKLKLKGKSAKSPGKIAVIPELGAPAKCILRSTDSKPRVDHEKSRSQYLARSGSCFGVGSRTFSYNSSVLNAYETPEVAKKAAEEWLASLATST